MRLPTYDSTSLHVEATDILVNGRGSTEEQLSRLELDVPDSSSEDSNDDAMSDLSSWSMHSGHDGHDETRQVTFDPDMSAQHPLNEESAELSQLQTMIQFLITTLYKLPIRQPAASERLSTKLSDTPLSVQHFDIMFVRDTFPELAEEVAVRLGRLVSLRRQLLSYRQDHSRHLQPRTPVKKQISLDQQPSPDLLPGPAVPTNPLTLKTAPSVSTAQYTSSQPDSWPSKATTHRRAEGEEDFLYPTSLAPSECSRASSNAAQNLRVFIPSRPCDQNRKQTHFLCPYCSITQHIKSDSIWRKHLFDDLQPYVCTHSGCGLQDHFFATKNQWYQHEMQEHRLVWHCNEDQHHEHNSKDDFVLHMNRDHNTSFTTEDADTLSSMFRRPTRSLTGRCNFCSHYSKNLRSHVARHLQRIALFALPRNNKIANSNSDQAQKSRGSEIAAEDDRTSAHEEDSQTSILIEGHIEAAQEASSIDPEYLQTEPTPTIPDSEDPEWHLITDKFVAMDTSECELLLARLMPPFSNDSSSVLRQLGLELKRLESWGMIGAVEATLLQLRRIADTARRTTENFRSEIALPSFWKLFVVNYGLTSFIEHRHSDLDGPNLLSAALRLDPTSLGEEPEPQTVEVLLAKGANPNAFDHRIGAVPWQEFLKRIWSVRETADAYQRDVLYEVTQLMVQSGAVIYIPGFGPSVENILEDVFGLQRLTTLMDIPRPERSKADVTLEGETDEYRLHELNTPLSEQEQMDRAIWLSLQPADSQGKRKRAAADTAASDSEDEEEELRRAIRLSLQADE